MSDIRFPFWQEARKLLVDMGDGTHAERVIADVSPGQSLGKGDLVTDAWGIQKISYPFSLFHGMWTYDIPPQMWFMYHNGTQVYTSTNIVSSGGVAKVATSGAVDVALLESKECPRYQPNRGHLYSTALWCPSKTAAAVRDFGLFTAENGVFFRLKSDGKLYAVQRSAGIETREELIDTSVLTGFDVQKNNIYDIQFQWRAAGNYLFYIGDPATGVSKLVYTFDNLGKLTAASMENPALPIAYKVTNAGADAEINIGCADVTSENGQLDVHQYDSAYSESVATTGNDKPVLIVKSPLQINGKTNTRTVQLARITVTCDKKATFKVWATRDPAAITGATYAPIGAGSYIETDSPNVAAGAVRATAVNTALLRNITAIPVQAGISRQVDNPLRERITFPLVRGDYLVITVSGTGVSSEAVAEWGEQI